MPVIVGARFWHSVSCYQFSHHMKQLLFFGGCPGAPEELISGGCWAKLAATVVLELGKHTCRCTYVVFMLIKHILGLHLMVVSDNLYKS